MSTFEPDRFNRDVLDAVRGYIMGARSGKLKEAQQLLGKLPPESRPAAGKSFTALKAEIESQFAAELATAGRRRF